MGRYRTTPAAAGSTPLAAVTAPTATTEAVAAGGTPAAKTFGAFTDPDGRIASYAAAIVNATGSTAIAAGSGLGAYTVSGHADGDGYTITLTALDSGAAALATATHTVRIAAASAGSWVELANLDYTGLDVQSPLSDAAVTVTKGAVQYGPAIAVDRVSSSIAVISTGAAGVTIAGASNAGSLNFGANLSAYLDFAKLLYLPLRIDFICTGITGVDSSVDGVQAGILTGSSYATASQERSTRLNHVSAGLVNTYASRQNTNTGIATNVTQPAGTFTLTTVLHANAMTSHWYTDGAPPANSVIEAGGTFALPANGSPVFPSTLWGVVRGIYTGGFTLTGIIISIFK